MYTLYWEANSGAFAIQVALEETDADYRRIEIDTEAGQNREPAYLSVNPMGQVPALVLEDGSVMTESAAILLHLADAHAGVGLAPPPGTPARARFDRWLIFAATNLYEGVLRAYYADRYTMDPDGAAGVKAAAMAHLDRGFDLIEQMVLDPGPYANGPAFSALDPYLAMLAWWHPEVPSLLAARPRLSALCDLVRRRPSVADIWPLHFPDVAV